jgi:hypothetical protein
MKSKYKTVAEALSSLWDFAPKTAFSGGPTRLYIPALFVQDRCEQHVSIGKLDRVSEEMRFCPTVVLTNDSRKMCDAYEYAVWRKAYPPNLPETK